MNFIDYNRSNSLLLNLNDLRLKNELCDITLKTADNENDSIVAHKNVLAASTPYFAVMFNGAFGDSKKNTILLKDINFESLKTVIEYLYTGSVLINQDNVQDLLYASSLLQISWIEDQCCNFLEKSMDVINCLGIKNYADRYRCKGLSHKTIQFIAENLEEVFNTDEFFTLTFEELNDILLDEEIYTASDDIIYKAIIRWIEYNSEERKQHLPQLLEFIHPALVSEDLVSQTKIVVDNTACSEWSAKALKNIGRFEFNIFIIDKIGKTSDLSKYNVTSKNYMELKSAPEPAFAVSFVARKNFLYVLGGQTSPRHMRDIAYFYNIYRNKWFQLTTLIRPRSHHRSCIVDNTIYSIGGNDDAGSMCSVECLDLNAGRTYEIQGMLDERRSLAAAAKDSCLYVMGGEDDIRSYRSTQLYDPRIGVWSRLADMNEVNSYCSCAIINESMYCCEGLANCLERYDFRMNTWEINTLPEVREIYDLFTVDNQLFATSGAEISKYWINTDQWETVYKFQPSHEWDAAVSLSMQIF